LTAPFSFAILRTREQVKGEKMKVSEFTTQLHKTVDAFESHMQKTYPELSEDDMTTSEWYEQFEVFIELYGVSESNG
jgi:hypothetical protein